MGLGAALWGCGESKIDQIKNGGGCVDESSAGTVGRCPGEVSACQVGFADVDGTTANGCETALVPAGDYRLFRVANGGMAQLVTNGYPLDVDVTGGWVALRGAVCTARMSAPCSYELLALQVQVSDFVFDGLAFTDGAFMLPKPLAVVDDGEGAIVPAGSGIVGTFTVGGKKRVVSLGTASKGMAVQTDGKDMTTTGSGLVLSFGGCTMEVSMTASGRPFDGTDDADTGR